MSSEQEQSESKPFTERGKCLDEVKIIFEDGQILFVSQNFLIMASPVFEVMFKSDFKEKHTLTVDIKGKCYDDFMEFLLCIHPAVNHEINKSNVLRIVPIAEEYQVTSVIHNCETCMKDWLLEELKTAVGQHYIEHRVIPARNCFNVLKIALLLNYGDLVSNAVKVIAKFGHRIYYGEYTPNTISQSDLDITLSDNGKTTPVKDVSKECRELFRSFPETTKHEILSERQQQVYQD